MLGVQLTLWILGFLGILGTVLFFLVKFIRTDSFLYDNDFVWSRKVSSEEIEDIPNKNRSK
ncbi:hypothetical protein ERICI_03396 [Paenibacillus larvae subsp. larvae]|uniref:Uncharacterized protein n=1 Tax=Paenibacillus larvae subsp. larvae TaxID=147375 RepID=A0A2L1TY51_9BACL|nr:hypothetical protein BXP28_00315 [Paenibacillus larvae subsp. larvae]AQZ45640.1 hypothetical protein B5S25_02520 [Paenibacillus larvae subsp. pulvifaciens]ETK26160.1 hypothetical protein ERIC1_2c03580 [Paenibacillus larvae subsp. larvae DSM 25719]MBH0341407.1 hypothetical protein [Paenibacillus larvae]AVF23164.1 hypothetical protein ERICI_03396 [Paenibacillus larvae subsp. larvae]